MDKLYEMFAKCVTAVALIVATLAVGAILMAFPLKWCWNYAIPGIFHLKEIGFWEAFCLAWVAGSLIKSVPTKVTKD